MKFRNIYEICRNTYSSIDSISGENVTIGSRNGVHVSGWDDASHALIKLRKIESLKNEADTLFDAAPEFYRDCETFNVTNEEWSRILLAKKQLMKTMDVIVDLYETMGMNTDDERGLDIKLPKFNDFSEFVKYIEDIEFVLTKCPFLQDDNEKLIFENVDIGSTWLTFFVVGGISLFGVSVLLNNVAAFIDKCIVIRSHYLTIQQQKNELEAEKSDEAEKRIISKYLDNLYKKEVDSAIKELEETTKHKVKNDDGDEFGRIEQCFEKMGNLIEKGLQIRANINSSKETRALFEPLEMKYIEVDNTLKLLEKKEE